MSSIVAQVRDQAAVNGHDERRMLQMWCPGCDDLHQVHVTGTDAWEWDGNLDAPTISPSILAQYGKRPADGGWREKQCHSFLKGGIWQFLTDSTHALAGQASPMVPLPEWLVREADTEGEPS